MASNAPSGRPPVQDLPGYAKIARRMANQPGLTIVRQFKALNTLLLLYKQSQIVAIEQKLRKQANEDHEKRGDGDIEQYFSRSWAALSCLQNDGKPREQWSIIIEELEPRLNEYNRMLREQAHLERVLQKPTEEDVQIVLQFTKDPSLRNTEEHLMRWENEIWSDGKRDNDLISVGPVHEFDTLTHWLIKCFMKPYHYYIGRQMKKKDPNADLDLYYYKDSHVEFPAYIISMGVASLLPVLAIVVLYFVENMGRRLGILAAFTAAFAMSLAFFSSARQVDIFTATSAFAAVMVVFIGTNT